MSPNNQKDWDKIKSKTSTSEGLLSMLAGTEMFCSSLLSKSYLGENPGVKLQERNPSNQNEEIEMTFWAITISVW